MDPMEVKATIIQNWWRRLCESRCYTCDKIYIGTWNCDGCDFMKWVYFMESRHEDKDILEKEIQLFRARKEEEWRKRQEKKRALGLIP